MIDTKRLATDAAYWRECGAPEWATHWDMEAELFVSKDSIWVDGEEKVRARKAILANFGRYIPRPQSEWVDGLTEWDGVSAPAPGELAVTSGGKCQVLGWDAQRKQVAVQWYDGEMGVITLAALKPIPTKAQSDRDELAALCKRVFMQQTSSTNPYTFEKIADAIIADGWRKAGEE